MHGISHLLCGKVVGVIEISACCVAIDNAVIIKLAAEPEVESMLRNPVPRLLLVVAKWIPSVGCISRINMQ